MANNKPPGWTYLNGNGSSVSNASFSPLNPDTLLLIGGKNASTRQKSTKSSSTGNGTFSSPFLQIQTFSISAGANWIGDFVNTAGILNRSHHASAEIKGGKILVFGGSVWNNANAENVLEIKSSLFGLIVSISERASRGCFNGKGMTACTVGVDKTAVLLYGGATAIEDNKPQFSSDVWLYLVEGASESSWVKLNVEGSGTDCPCARAYHSCVVAGPNNNFVFLFGGQADSGLLLNDCWMLDVSAVLDAIATASPLPAVRWSALVCVTLTTHTTSNIFNKLIIFTLINMHV